MTKKFLSPLLLFGALIFLASGVFYWRNLKGVGPVIKKPPQDIGRIINTTGMPLSLPPGFSIDVFAKNIPGARVMVFDTFGNLWVSQTTHGMVSLLEIQKGSVTHQYPVFQKLQKPHGIAFDPQKPFEIYIAEEHRISHVGTYSEGELQKIVNLPADGGHYTRTIGFGPDRRLYVSIGSSCNACVEKDFRRAKIFSMNAGGGDFKEFARGIRNAVFFIWHPETEDMWSTEMGRDFLGDDLPPDEINRIEEGENYGWPICYGKNIHDTDFDKNIYLRNPCEEPFEVPAHVDLEAHSAPLGLAFVPSGIGWPKDYEGDLLVAYHGSWNRSKPTGYKIVRIDNFEANPTIFDFISGWLVEDGALGRPVDLKFKDRILYISDDKAGVIYKVTHEGRL